MKKICFITVLLFISLFTFADDTTYDVEINGIFYRLNNDTKEASVVAGGKISISYSGPDRYYHIDYVHKYKGDVVIPESFVYNNIKYTVTSIKGYNFVDTQGIGSFGAFADCEELTSVTIPKTIKTIDSGSFSRKNTSLKAVYISDLSVWCNIVFDVETDGIFYNSSGKNPLYYAHDLYLNGSKITELVVPDDVKALRPCTFIGNSFSSIVLHKDVYELYEETFYPFDSVKDIYYYGTNLNVLYKYYDIHDDTNSAISEKPKPTWHIRGKYKDQIKTGHLGGGKIEFIEGIDITIKYMVDGELYKQYFPDAGSAIVPEPYPPTKDGYKFSGWSEIPEIMPNHDVTVTGNFIPNQYKLMYYVDGKEYKTFEISYNETIIPEFNPVKKGMTFSGWSEIPKSMPAHDVTVTGTFSWSKLTKDNVLYEVSDTINNYCKVIRNSSASGEIKIDSVEIDGYYYQPTEIANKAFYGCKNITKIEIPATVTTICERAFANIDKLTDVTCWAEDLPTIDRTAFENSYIEDYVTLHVPYGAVAKYKETAPWKNFKSVVATDSSTPEIPETKKCEKPTISYTNGQLFFASGTDGAEFIYEITESVQDSGTGSEVKLGNTTTYHISVYATKEGYENSEVATKDITMSVGLKGDVNDDGKIDVEDVVGVVNIILDGNE